MGNLRAEGNERIDLDDFVNMSDTNMDSIARGAGSDFFASASASARSWVLTGFDMTNPALKQLTVTRGRAILAARINGSVQYGYLTTEGDVSKTVDLVGLGAGTYGVYIRFEKIADDSATRLFWNPAAGGSEYAQTIATRYSANWSVRVELTSPGSDWLLIGTAQVTGAPTLTLVDKRNLYFEGSVDSSYASGWSTDGGGVANDRNATRKTYGASDLHTFIAATRQCLVDIKGRGLKKWYSRDIGGMNIGFDADPVSGTLAIGDDEFTLALDGPGRPTIWGDPNTFMTYVRASHYWDIQTDGVTSFNLKYGIATGGEVGPDVTDGGICIKGDSEFADAIYHTIKDKWCEAHPFTALAQNDTFLQQQVEDSFGGGIVQKTFAHTTGGGGAVYISYQLNNYTEEANDIITASAQAALTIRTAKSNGTTGAAVVDADENLVVFANHTDAKCILQGNGTILLFGAAGVADAIATPATRTGFAQIYADSTGGNLKVKFGSGGIQMLSNIPSAEQAITVANGVTAAMLLLSKHLRISGDGGAVDVGANPQIAPGVDGEELILEGRDNVNTVKFESGDGLSLVGSAAFTMGKGDILALTYNAADVLWYERYRANN